MMFSIPRAGLVCLFVGCLSGFVHSWYEEKTNKPTYLTANVGEYVVFNCELDFPQDIPIPYILRWNKDVSLLFFYFVEERNVRIFLSLFWFGTFVNKQM